MTYLFQALAAGVVFCGALAAEQPQAAPDKNQAEITTKESPATFKTRVNLVMVPVVVRDGKGHAIGTLHQEDFQLFDKGKPQAIARFSLERPSGKSVKETTPADTVPPITNGDQARPGDIPERFVAYLFDDRHLGFGDLAQVRDAALRHLATLQATDRAAIYTTSGHNQLEFTDDHDKLREALLRIRPESISDPASQQCLQMSYYLADMIANRGDVTALGLAVKEVGLCLNNSGPAATAMVRANAYRMIALGREETRTSLAALKDVVRRLSGMPGQRTVVLVSPGFITPESIWRSPTRSTAPSTPT